MKPRTLSLLVTLCSTLVLVCATSVADTPAVGEVVAPVCATPAPPQIAPAADTDLAATLATSRDWAAAAADASDDVMTRGTCYVRCGEIDLTFYHVNMQQCLALIEFYCS